MINPKYPYSLEPGSKKHHCPACGKKRFVRYVDNKTSSYINSEVGCCDRRENCGYHYRPSEYFSSCGERPDYEASNQWKHRPKAAQKNYTLPSEYMEQTLGHYDENDLVLWMATLPGWNKKRAERAALRYYLGTGRQQAVHGWAIFWQVDTQQKVRTGKMVRYNPATGKRKKDGYSYNWTHKLLADKNLLPDNWELVQCFYGAHLLHEDLNKPVAIVESEKTAIVASEYMPDMIWLACGSLNGLQAYKLDSVKSRRVVLFPDAGKAYKNWKAIATVHDLGISDILERIEAEAGSDIADYLSQIHVDEFNESDTESSVHIDSRTGEVFDYPAEWDNVPLPESDSFEYIEMLKAEHEAGIELPIEELRMLDAKLSLIADTFNLTP